MPLLYYIYTIVQSAVGIIGLLSYKRYNKSLRFLVWYIVFVSVVGWFTFSLGRLGIRNLWFYHFSIPIEFLLSQAVFYYWRVSKGNGKLIVISSVLYIVFCIVAMVSFQPLTQSNDLTHNLSASFQVYFSVILLLAVFRDDKTIWKNDPRFWAAAGFVLYASGTLLLFGSFNFLLTISKQLLKDIWPLNWILSMITNLLFLRAFLCKPANTGTINPPINNNT